MVMFYCLVVAALILLVLKAAEIHDYPILTPDASLLQERLEADSVHLVSGFSVLDETLPYFPALSDFDEIAAAEVWQVEESEGAIAEECYPW